MKVDYSKTFIYKLCCNDINIKDIYVGHSTDYKSRNQSHKKSCNNVNNKSYNAYKYQFIRDNGGYENWRMIKLYDYPCNSKREAEMEEDKTMRELGATLNSYRAYVTEEEKKEWQKQYEEKRKNDPKRIQQQKEYRKKKYEDNKEESNKKCKEWRENNKEHLKEYNEKRKNNPEYIKWRKEYEEKRKNDPEYIKWQKEYEEKRKNKPERIEYKKNYCIEYYQNHKDELKQKVKCQYCNTELNKSSLKKHQKTKSCLKFQECMIIDDE